MELRDALSHIAEIRLRMAETELFRGYRSLPVAMSGLLAALSATRKPTRMGKFAMTGLALNGVSLAIPILLLVVAVGRLLV